METFPYEEVTIMQYPVVVDADDDGMAEIVSVGSDKLNFIESDGSMWAPARKVWNQYMYNVTNVNNDLTVTQYQFNNATPFVDQVGVVRRPFNNFLQQGTTIDQYGLPFMAAADASIDNISMENFVLKVDYSNNGDYKLFAPYVITAFENHFGGNILATNTVTSDLKKKENAEASFSLGKNALCGNTDLNNIVVAINYSDAGIAQYGGNQHECDTANNIGVFDFSSMSTAANTITITKVVCEPFTWYGNTYYESGTYTHTVVSEETCDSIINLELINLGSSGVQIDGLTDLTIASNLWPGIYNYCLPDSAFFPDCDIHWTISDPVWPLYSTNSKYCCQLIVADTVDAVLHVNIVCEDGCNLESSLQLHVKHIYEGDTDESNVVAFPNPAKNTLTVQADLIKSMSIYDVYGHKVKDCVFRPTNKAVVDVQDLRRGMYFIEVKTHKDIVIKKVVLY